MNETIFLAIQVCVLTVCVCMSIGTLTFMTILLRWLMREMHENTGPKAYCYTSTAAEGLPAPMPTWNSQTSTWSYAMPPPEAESEPSEPKPSPEMDASTTVRCPTCCKPMKLTGTSSDEHGNSFYFYVCCGKKHAVKAPKA